LRRFFRVKKSKRRERCLSQEKPKSVKNIDPVEIGYYLNHVAIKKKSQRAVYEAKMCRMKGFQAHIRLRLFSRSRKDDKSLQVPKIKRNCKRKHTKDSELSLKNSSLEAEAFNPTKHPSDRLIQW